MPLPPAEFSPFTTIKSMFLSSRNFGTNVATALRPGSPTISPKKSNRDSYYVEAFPNELPSWILNNTVHTVVLL